MKYIYFGLFIGTVFLANWLINHVGTICIPNGPCLIPVWPGIMAPSGVLAVGLAFTLRDLVQHNMGVSWTILAIVIGAALSAWISPALALASGCAFLFSEMMDLGIYTPLHKKNLLVALILSNIAGLVVDSIIFLSLAFGSLDLLIGQIIGKFWMTILVIPIILVIRKKRNESTRVNRQDSGNQE